MEENVSKAIKGIDWKILRKQKLHLLEIIGEESVSVEQHESLEGIVCLIDGIQDEAAEKLSEEVVFAQLEIKFAVNGSVVQNIQILNGEEPEVFFEKIKSGKYLTSIGSGEVLYINGDFEKVGEVKTQEALEDTEFDDFELN